ncbi:hypothetical protein LCFBJUUZ_CDS0174 [Staphylococcus phage PG-2021_76]|uniref:Uncharacterized protein n=1 Tax=Mammaliicoccus phage MSShimriz1 TaxID=3230127 RepID=A0AAU8GS03_9VIRU
MSYILIIITVVIFITTINSVSTILQIRSVERERVKEGYAPFSNFDYYYPIGSWVLGTLVLGVLALFANYMPQPTNVWWLLLACITVVIIHFVSGLISSGILSVLQANKVKKDNQQQLNQ